MYKNVATKLNLCIDLNVWIQSLLNTMNVILLFNLLKWVWMGLILRDDLKDLISIKMNTWSSKGDDMCLLSSFKEWMFECWLFLLIFQPWIKKGRRLFIGKLPLPFWKSRCALTSFLGLRSWLRSHLLWLWLWLWPRS